MPKLVIRAHPKPISKKACINPCLPKVINIKHNIKKDAWFNDYLL